MQDGVALEAGGVEVAFCFQHLIEFGDSKSRISAKEAHQVAGPIAGDDGSQNLFPVIGTVHVALAQGAALQIAELIKRKRRMIALAAKVAVPCSPLLIAMGRADGAVHVESDPLGRLRIVHRIGPLAGQVSQSRTIMSRSKNVSLGPCQLTC